MKMKVDNFLTIIQDQDHQDGQEDHITLISTQSHFSRHFIRLFIHYIIRILGITVIEVFKKRFAFNKMDCKKDCSKSEKFLGGEIWTTHIIYQSTLLGMKH